MKVLIIIFFATLFILSSFSQAVTTPVNNEVDKKLSFINADYDMGRIPAGKPVEYNLTIKNISKDTFELQDVKVGCGCTTPKFRSGDKILPGKSTFISLGFNGGASGEFTKTADVIFSNGLTKQVKFNGFALTDSTKSPPPSIPNN